MPEYLAPGVYVEEVSFRAKSIEGVGTTTTGFVGPARFGPVTLDPDVVTSLEEFERLYGDGDALRYADGAISPNFLWHAARAFFGEGGTRLYVTRVFRPDAGAYPPADFTAAIVGTRYPHGHARGVTARQVSRPAGTADLALTNLGLRARFPGTQGNLRVRVTLRSRANLLGNSANGPTFGALAENDIVWARDAAPANGAFYRANRDPVTRAWRFSNATLAAPVNAAAIDAVLTPADPAIEVRVVTLTVDVLTPDGRSLMTSADLALDPAHSLGGLPDSVFDRFAAAPNSLALARSLPIVLTRDAAQIANGIDTLNALFGADPTQQLAPTVAEQARGIGPAERLARGVSVEIDLEGGNDGQRPGSTEYEGRADDTLGFRTGLRQLESVEDIAIVAAPGVTWRYATAATEANATIALLINHAERMRYRIAVLDSGDGQTVAEVRDMRARLDSKYAALYYPWVTVLDPITRAEINLPPSGFVAGIYARNDITRAVWKAPANEVVTLATGFETLLNRAQQEVLNPLGVNCFRYFEGRGLRLWGARTISSDPEWKYVNLRRYFAYLERSIDIGTQWAVFEPNGRALWDNVRRTVEDFLLNEWMQGALLGDKPEKAFFVRCGFPVTMTQNDLDNGRLVCLVGVAALRPAEFVIFRIGQWTADQRPPG